MRTVYILFSSTHTRIGAAIRSITGFKYNHVSIGFSPDSDVWYSFGRYNRAVPWTGGFVEETHSRLCDGGDISVCVCAWDVPDTQYKRIRHMVSSYKDSRISEYNYLAAMLVPMNVQVITPATYTCVGFVIQCLDLPAISIEQLFNCVSGRVIYCGSYMQLVKHMDESLGDQYWSPISYRKVLRQIFHSWKILVYRYMWFTQVSHR